MILRKCLLAASLAAFSAMPVLAQQTPTPLPDREPSAMDVAKTPVTDLNIAKQEIPELLINAQARPYDLTGMGRCPALIAEVTRLDEILGPDIDLPQEARDRISAGRVAKTVVSSFIPFRGLIREVSGANAHDRAVQAAIQAGLARRGFLKGVGESKRCAYPARPATQAVIAAVMADREAEQAAKEREKAEKAAEKAQDSSN